MGGTGGGGVGRHSILHEVVREGLSGVLKNRNLNKINE